MSTLGKVLTVFNVLAAIGFLVLAAADYNARQNWAYSVFRHELAINGLPLDDKDDSWRPGVPIVRDVNDRAVRDLFGDPNGPRTQLAAVESAKAVALQLIEDAKTDAEKRKAIAAVWLPLLPHAYQRENLLEKNLYTKSVADLTAGVSGLFDEVAQAITSGQGGPEVSRQKVAHLLYNFNPTGDPALRTWTQNVVGLEQYVAAADRQASNLSAMTDHFGRVLVEDNAIFVRTYETLVARLGVLNEQLEAEVARLDAQKRILESNNLLYQARRAERDELTEQLRVAREAAASEAGNLATLQKQLFDLQRDVAAARTANERLEAEIRGKTVGR
jgi:hypothetical protein